MLSLPRMRSNRALREAAPWPSRSHLAWPLLALGYGGNVELVSRGYSVIPHAERARRSWRSTRGLACHSYDRSRSLKVWQEWQQPPTWRERLSFLARTLDVRPPARLKGK